MNKLLFALAAPALLAAMPAAAVVPLINSPITVTSADVGKSFTYNFNGIIDEKSQSGLQSSITFTLLSVVGKTWNMKADINNTLSVAPVGGRISSFGFNGNPEIIGATPGAGPFDNAIINGSFPQTGGQTKIDFCLTDGNNCSGGRNGGVANNTSATQEFALSFANNSTSVIFNNFIVRYQSVTGSRLGTSGIGLGTGGGGFDPGGEPVPEPSSWALLIAGFGLVGATMRRRRAIAA
jgi:hypothetical protein